MQNFSNIGKDSQAKPEELNMAKLIVNCEILTLDNESMSNEPKSIEEQMIEFRKKKYEKYLQYINVIQRKHTTKMNPSFHQSLSVKLI